MKVLLDRLHLNFYTQEFYPNIIQKLIHMMFLRKEK